MHSLYTDDDVTYNRRIESVISFSKVNINNIKDAPSL